MVNKLFLIPFFLFFVGRANTQTPVPISKVTKDSISIKWIPNNFDQFKRMLTEEVTIRRVELNENISLENIDFSNGKLFKLNNGEANYKKLENEEWFLDSYELLLSPYFDQENMEENDLDFAFALSLVANLSEERFQFICGNILVDKDYDRNKKYAYKITTGKESFRILVDPSKITKYPSVDFELSLDKKKTIDIEWKSKAYNKNYFGFQIEKAIGNKKALAPMDSKPYLPFRSSFEKEGTNDFLRDDSLIQGEYHFYRISGIDLFGQKQSSDIIKKIYVPKLTNAWINIDTIEAKDYNRTVKGVIHPKGEMEQINLNSIQLFRSSKSDKDFELLKEIPYDNTDSLFNMTTEVALKTGDAYYYKVIAFNKDKDTIFSLPHYFFTLDQEPPGPIQELTGEIDSLGIVDLHWKPSEDKDIRGYRVYRANAKKEEFIEKTTRLNLILNYRDTLSLDNLTSEIYYFVVAVDSNYNNSAHSDTLLLMKPDTIAPIPSIIKSVKRIDSLLAITWINSTSSDFKSQALVRTCSATNEIDTLLHWSDSTVNFQDFGAVMGEYNSYQIITWDNSKNSSLSNNYELFFEPGYRKKITFIVEVNRADNNIILKWEKPKDKVFSYKLFKGKTKEDLSLIKTIGDPSQTSFKDIDISINNKYFYAIKYVNSEGIHSIPSIKQVIY